MDLIIYKGWEIENYGRFFRVWVDDSYEDFDYIDEAYDYIDLIIDKYN